MGLFDNIKEGFKAHKESKRIQNEIQKITGEYTNGGITVVARGDMTIASITMAEGAYDEVKAGKSARFETMLLNVINGALKKARENMQVEVAKMMQNSEVMSGLFGK
jgi:DNA-binding protein YbaB